VFEQPDGAVAVPASQCFVLGEPEVAAQIRELARHWNLQHCRGAANASRCNKRDVGREWLTQPESPSLGEVGNHNRERFQPSLAFRAAPLGSSFSEKVRKLQAPGRADGVFAHAANPASRCLEPANENRLRPPHSLQLRCRRPPRKDDPVDR
jgi:hypothetical protein